MPLKSGEDNIGANIEELKRAGYKDPKQRLAIVLSKLRESKHEKKEEDKSQDQSVEKENVKI